MSDPTVPPPPPYSSPPPPPPMSSAPNSNRGIMIVLSYLGILGLIPLLADREDSEVQWHARNGLILTVAMVLIWIAFAVIGFMLVMVHLGIVGCFLNLVHLALFLGYLVLIIMCIVKGTQGGRFRIPVISQYADTLKF
jgi:uncharacterized membrane protein